MPLASRGAVSLGVPASVGQSIDQLTSGFVARNALITAENILPAAASAAIYRVP